MSRTARDWGRCIRRARFVGPIGFLMLAATLAVVYLSCHLLGWREHVGFLSGTWAPGETGESVLLMGVLYVLSYFGFVLAVPILVLGAAIFRLLLRFAGPRHSPEDHPAVRSTIEQTDSGNTSCV